MATPFSILIRATLVAFALIATGTSAIAAETTVPQPSSKTSIGAQDVGVFTGKFANGMAVYRFPPVNVIANRKAELAKLKLEEQLARNKQVRAKAAARGPA
jgi:hypothetical protein